MNQGPDSKLRRRLPYGWVAKWPLEAFSGKLEVGRKDSAFRAGRLEARDRKK